MTFQMLSSFTLQWAVQLISVLRYHLTFQLLTVHLLELSLVLPHQLTF